MELIEPAAAMKFGSMAKRPMVASWRCFIFEILEKRINNFHHFVMVSYRHVGSAAGKNIRDEIVSIHPLVTGRIFTNLILNKD